MNLYQSIVRPVLFLFPPEFVHRMVAGILPFMVKVPGVAWMIRKHYCLHDPKLEREVFGIRFPNPVGMAAGFDKEAKLYNVLSDFGFGFVEIGTVTPLGQKGNPRPRLFRLPKDKALINRMGFNNHGIDDFTAQLRKRKARVIIGGNIGKNTLTTNEDAAIDYCHCFRELFPFVDYFVVNISCPNIKDLNKLQNRDELVSLLEQIQEINLSKQQPKPILLKISPDLNPGQLDEVIDIIRETKLDGIVATNTTTLRENLSTPTHIVAKAGQGGLSGEPLRDKSTSVIRYLHKKSEGKIPIIGVGGIGSPSDAREKLKAGATLVQVYTGFIYHGPSLAKQINRSLL